MENLEKHISTACSGDKRAFEEIIKLFQDMAFGNAYSLLGDRQLAEDAAQESFTEAYCCLSKLNDDSAFPSWFRSIVKSKCDRFVRRKRLKQVPLQSAGRKASNEPGPYELMERKYLEQQVFEAVSSLSLPLREATMLYYINGYSHRDISEFLEIPVNTIKSRLGASRTQLKKILGKNDMIREVIT